MPIPASSPLLCPSIPAHALAATPIAFVRAIVQAYERRGISPANALAQAQIAPVELLDSASRITAWQMERISGLAMQELDDEALGWFSRRLPWGSYGMLARASLSAPTLGVALKRWCRHHGLIADDIALTLSVTGDTAQLAITELHDLGDLREFCLVSVLRNILGVACWLIDSRIPLLGAQFPFAPPAHREAYGVLFSGPTAFDTGPAAIRFDARYLSLALRRDERALQQMLQRALPLTVLPYRQPGAGAQRRHAGGAAERLAAHPAPPIERRRRVTAGAERRGAARAGAGAAAAHAPAHQADRRGGGLSEREKLYPRL